MTARPQADPRHQRSHGVAELSFARLDGVTRLGILRQVGSARAILPRMHGALPEVVFLNTSGGLTGGDRLTYGLDLGPGARVVATTQTAERAYASGGGTADVQCRFRIGAGGHLDWLPQETIVFDGAAISRDTVVDLAPDASCLMLESVVLGRHAMGEAVARVAFRDCRIIRVAGRVEHLEPTTLSDVTLRQDRAALLGEGRAYASIVGFGPVFPDKLAAVRAVLNEDGVMAGASAFSRKLCLRLLGADARALRRQILRVLAVLRSDAPLPRVWQN